MKKRKGNLKDETCTQILSLPDNYVKHIITNDLIQIVINFQKAQKVEEQVVLMPQLVEFIKPPASHDMEVIIKLLVHILLSVNSKHPLKKSVTRLFANISNIKPLSNNISLEYAKQLLQKITYIETKFDVENTQEIHIKELEEVNNIINNINCCFENFPIGFNSLSHNIIEIFAFLVRSFYLFADPLGYVTSNIVLQKLYQFIHNTTRAIISTSQHLNIRNNIYKTYKLSVYKRCVIIMNNVNIPYDTKSNCGIIMILFANHTKEFGYNDLLKICLEPEIPWFVDDTIKDLTSEIGIICIFSGVLNVVKPEELLKRNSMYFYLITYRLSEILSSSANNPSIILGVNRTMLLISKNIQNLSINNLLHLLNILLNYVWMNLDHGIDTVRHIAKSIFVNIIKLVISHPDGDNSTAYDTIIKKTLSLPVQRSCRYRAISILANEIGTTELLNREPKLVKMLLKQLKDDSISSEVVLCYESLMKANIEEAMEDDWIQTWISPLLDQLRTNEKLNFLNKSFQDLLSSAIKLKPILLQSILPKRNLENVLEFSSLLKCALIARQLGKVCDDSENVWRGLLEPVILEQAKYHQNDEIRLLSLSLVCDSHKSTEIYSKWELCFIIEFVSYNIGTLLPSTRQQIVSLMRRILIRFNESYKLICRNINKNIKKDINDFNKNKSDYEKFIKELRSVLFTNIFYGANFIRRSLALEILSMMRPIYENITEKWNEDEINLMLMSLTDSYENNKKLATKFLSYCPVSLLKFDDENHVKNLLEKSVNMTYNVKPSAPMTAAYLIETLMYSPVLSKILRDVMNIPQNKNYSKEYLVMRYLCIHLRCHYEMTESNLLIAARSSPIHGIMFCVRHILMNIIPKIKESYWMGIFNELIKVCIQSSNVVSPVVKNSSPEGHLPMDQKPVILFDGDDIEQTVTSQMLLVCAWRTIKEISLLLSDICLNIPIINDKNGLITKNQVVSVGEHFCELLVEIRHRGAFEHAYVGFSKVLNRLWKSNSSELHQLPIEWLQNIMGVISGKNVMESKLCITRRSAGVPFMIQAIVSSEILSGGSKYFNSTMETLLDFGLNNDSVETRTHAMNILRALYRNTQLGEMVMPFLAEGFKVAITGFNKPTWSERNSATLLFASLMTRMFGVQRNRDTDKINVKNCLTIRIFNQRFPSLQPFLLEKLKIAVSTFDTEKNMEGILYPVLNILSRLYPVGLEEDVKNSLNEFVPYVMLCANGHILKTRELAARALSSILNENSKIDIINKLLINLEDVKNNNYLHGILLQIHQLVKDIPDIQNVLSITNIVDATKWILSVPCPIVSALYMQILLQLPLQYLDANTNMILNLLESLDTILQNKQTLTSTICLRSAFHLKLHLISHTLDIPLEIRCLKIQEVFFNKFTKTTTTLYNFTLNFLIYLLSDNRSSLVIQSWDIPPEEKNLADLYTEAMKNNMLKLLSSDINSTAKLVQPFLKQNDLIGSKTLAYISYIPSIFNKINLVFFKNDVDYIINHVKDQCDNNMTCAALMCMKNIDDVNFDKNLLKFSKLLWEFSSDIYNTACRYIVTEIIIDHAGYLTTPREITTDNEVEATSFLWLTVMRLLGDNEIEIRNKMSGLVQVFIKTSLPVVPDIAREILLLNFINVFSQLSVDTCVLLLLYWIFEDNNVVDDDEQYDGQIFEKGDQGNTFAENQLLGKLAVQKLSLFFIGREKEFFMDIQELLVEKENNIWIPTPEQKTIFSYYNKKIYYELSCHGDFNRIKNNIKNSFDFWSESEDAIRWKYLDILQSFSE